MKFIQTTILCILMAITCDLTAQMSDTNQNQCYNTQYEIPCPKEGEALYGQDANYQINPVSFSKLDAQSNELPESASQWAMVKDNVTGLIWEVKHPSDSIENFNNPHDADNKYIWLANNDTGYTNTSAFIKNLNAMALVAKDWRLPDVVEMMSLFDLSRFLPSMNPSFFEHTMHSGYWTSTPDIYNTENAWTVLFSYGGNNYENKSSLNHVRAVRGQPLCAEDRFKMNPDGTITDNCTGFMWQSQVSETSMSWADALSWCEHLNHAGYTDWRLPNAKELLSISDYLHYSPAVNPDFFSNTVSSFYWTSSSYARYPTFAWAVYFRNAGVTYKFKSKKYPVRAVRGGQNIIPENLLITAPKAASLWCVGEQMKITWLPQGIDGNVKILISRDGGKNNSFDTIAESTENDGEHIWTVSGMKSDNCMLKIESENTSHLTTQGLFSIITNHPPTISRIDDIEIKEDGPPAFISFSMNDVETNPCDLIITTHVSNDTIFSKINMLSSDSCTDKVFSLTPKPDAFGETWIEITVTDQAKIQAIEHFKLSVLPVNDCPHFTISTTEIFLPADGDYRCFTNFISNVSPGPSNESDQNVSIEIETNNESIFEQYPQIFQNTGNLCFQTKISEFDQSILTIVLSDDGDNNRNEGSCNTWSETVIIDIEPCPLSIITRNDELFENPFPLLRSTIDKNIHVKCGKPPYNFTKTQGFPPTLDLDPSNGNVFGKFTETGAFYFRVFVEDEIGRKDSENYSVEIVNKLEIKSPSRLPSAILNEPYPKDHAIQVTGGKKPYSFSLCANSSPLPDSMTFSLTHEGYIEGIPETKGMYTFIVCVTSFDGQSVSNTFQFPGVDPIQLDTKNLYDAICFQPYEMQLNASCGYGKYLWKVENMPDGLSLDPETGLISGSPQIAGKYRMTLSITDQDGHHLSTFRDINIAETNPCLLQNELPSGRLNELYQQEIVISGGFSPYTISCYGLPDGLSWNSEQEIITGIPTEAGTKTVRIIVEDNRFCAKSFKLDEGLLITITDNIIITTPWKLDPVKEKKEIMPILLEARGGKAPYYWSVDTDSLPEGIQLSESNALVGTPSHWNDYYIKIHVRDQMNATAEKELYLKVYSQLEIITPVINEAVIGESYNQRIAAWGGYGNYQWKYSGVLPQGIKFDTDTGTLSGIPLQAYSAFDIHIEVSDDDANKINKRLTMEVLDKEVQMIVDFIPDGYVNEFYKASIFAYWGKPEYHWVVVNDILPPGLEQNTDDPFTFIIKGIPTEPGTYTFTLAVYDQSSMQKNYDKQALSISIFPIDELSIITQYLKDAILEKDENDQLKPTYYQEQIAAKGGQNYQYAVVKGRVPEGLEMNADGSISGQITSTSISEFFKIQVTDTLTDKTSEKEFWIRVIPELKINTQGFRTQIQWHQYETILDAAGGIPPYKWSFTQGRLPQSLKLNPITGKILGKFLECGSFPLTIKVQDSAYNRQSDTRSIDGLNVICEGGLKDLIIMLQTVSGFESKDLNMLIGSGLDNHIGLDDIICLLLQLGQ
ncbi:MAG: DUF1566 domain-containing protein [Candidatus Magnetomorum sp.]|nr:DUF1566 domain-containing protein [Candidatus Magnetomorum sp.]